MIVGINRAFTERWGVNMEQHESAKLEIDGLICDIDVECVDWVLFFNSIGMKTKFCCHGDDELLSFYEIVFHESVTDEQVYDFLKRNSKVWGFYKWVRTNGTDDTLLHNWVFLPRSKTIAKKLYKGVKK